MVFPRSRKRAPGLHCLMDSSRHLRAVRMSRCESSSTRPTGYVSFRSPWNPRWPRMRLVHIARRTLQPLPSLYSVTSISDKGRCQAPFVGRDKDNMTNRC